LEKDKEIQRKIHRQERISMKLKYNTKYEKYWTSEKEQRSVLTGIEADIDISMSEIDLEADIDISMSEIDYLVNMKDHIEYSYDMYDEIFAIVHKIRKSITGED
jgi:hypothetical protein